MSLAEAALAVSLQERFVPKAVIAQWGLETWPCVTTVGFVQLWMPKIPSIWRNPIVGLRFRSDFAGADQSRAAAMLRQGKAGRFTKFSAHLGMTFSKWRELAGAGTGNERRG